jgi:hypothetical protein
MAITRAEGVALCVRGRSRLVWYLDEYDRTQAFEQLGFRMLDELVWFEGRSQCFSFGDKSAELRFKRGMGINRSPVNVCH